MRSIGRSLLLLSVLLACGARAQQIAPDQVQCYTLADLNSFIGLPSFQNGQPACCSDCAPGTTPCTTTVTTPGSLAALQAGQWVCGFGGGGGSGPCFNPGPCSINDLTAEIDFYEPFLGTDDWPWAQVNDSLLIGAPLYGWTLHFDGSIAPFPSVNVPSSDFSRPGIREFLTGGSNNDVIVLGLSQTPTAFYGLTTSVTWYSQTALTVGDLPNSVMMVGFGNAMTMTPTNFIGFRHAPAESGGDWQCYTCAGGSCTATDIDGVTAMDTLRVRMVGTTPTVECAVIHTSGASVTRTNTTNIPSAGVLTPTWGLKATAAATKHFDVDYWLMRLAPSPIVYPSAPVAICSTTPTVIASGGGTYAGTIASGTGTTVESCSCGCCNGKEAVFQWTAGASAFTDIYVQATSPNTLSDFEIYVRDDSCTPSTPNGCTNAQPNTGINGVCGQNLGTTCDFSFHSVAGSTYYIFVDATAPASGPFELTLSQPASICTSPPTIPAAGGTVSGTIPSNTASQVSENPAICGFRRGQGPELLWAWTPTATGRADAYVVVSGPVSTHLLLEAWDGTVSCPGLETACANVTASPTGDYVAVDWDVVAGVTYYIVVDSDTPLHGGGSNVTLTVTAPPDMSCATATVIGPGTSGVPFTVNGDNSLVLPPAGEIGTGAPISCGCGGGRRAREQIFSWHPPTTGTATVTSCMTAPPAGVNNEVYVRDTNCESGSFLACSSNNTTCSTYPAGLTFTADSTHTYYIIVDGCNDSAPLGNQFTLKVTPP